MSAAGSDLALARAVDDLRRGEIIRVTTHPAEEVASWRTQAKRRVALTPEQEKLARLEPLDPPPVSHAAADELIARVTAAYPHEAFARLNAAGAMSDAGAGAAGAASAGAGSVVTGTWAVTAAATDRAATKARQAASGSGRIMS